MKEFFKFYFWILVEYTHEKNFFLLFDLLKNMHRKKNEYFI